MPSRLLLPTVLATGLAACGHGNDDAVIPEIGEVKLELTGGRLSAFAINVTLAAPRTGPTLIAVERIGLIDPDRIGIDPSVRTVDPTRTELRGEFAPGTARLIGPDQRAAARIVDAGTRVDPLRAHCGRRNLMLHLCLHSAKPQAPLTAGCGWRQGVEVRCH